MCKISLFESATSTMHKHHAVVSVHTIVHNNTRILDSTENYTRKRFTDVLILFGQALRKAALLHIDKHIIIVAGVIRPKEMASVHKELLPSCDDGIAKHRVVGKMCSFFLDHVTQHKKLLRIYQHTSYLYSDLHSEEIHCRKADTFFLEDFPAGKVHHYSCGVDNPPDQGNCGLFLCILIATGIDKAFSGSLALAGGVPFTSKFVYKMSAGDTCLLFGMYCLPDTAFHLTLPHHVPDCVSSHIVFRV